MLETWLVRYLVISHSHSKNAQNESRQQNSSDPIFRLGHECGGEIGGRTKLLDLVLNLSEWQTNGLSVQPVKFWSRMVVLLEHFFNTLRLDLI